MNAYTKYLTLGYRIKYRERSRSLQSDIRILLRLRDPRCFARRYNNHTRAVQATITIVYLQFYIIIVIMYELYDDEYRVIGITQCSTANRASRSRGGFIIIVFIYFADSKIDVV